MKYKNIIFDLDGTLVDSAPAILSSIGAAFDEVGILPMKKLNQSMIGPPLTEIFEKLVEESQKQRISSLLNRFKCNYDDAGYKNTRVFDGVPNLLNALNDKGYMLHIVTNKRLAPTISLIEMFKWSSIFKSIHSLDSFTPPLLNKKYLIEEMLIEQSIDVNTACYIGDRNEDGEAAQVNGLDFIMIEWGYDKPNGKYKLASKPEDLLNLLMLH